MAAFFGSTTTWVSRWGRSLYWPSSTRFGSTRMSRTWSGVARVRIEVSTELMQDDLPDPVAPETRTWGISARFAMTARPAMSRPRATSSGWVALAASGEARMSPERHQLAAAVRHLDADGRLARDGRQDPHVGRGHGVGDVLRQRRHPGHLHPGAELELVAGDRRAHRAPDQSGLHAVGGQGADQGGAGGVHLRLVDDLGLGPLEQVGRGQLASPPPGDPSASRAARPCRAGWPPRGAAAGSSARRSCDRVVPSVGVASSARARRLAGSGRGHGGHRGLAALGQGPAEGVGGLVAVGHAVGRPVTAGGGDRPPHGPGDAGAAVRTDTPVNTTMRHAATASSTTAAPKPPRAEPSGSAMTAPTQPPAADRWAVEAPRAGEPPASAARPATARRIRVPPMTARAGSRRGRPASLVVVPAA